MSEQARRLLTLMLYLAAGIAGGWLLLRWVLPCLAPFLLAWLLSTLMEKPVALLCRRGLRRGIAAGLVLLGLLSLVLLPCVLCLGRALNALTGLLKQLPELLGSLSGRLEALETRLLPPSELSGAGSEMLRAALDALRSTVTGIPANLSQGLLDALGRLARRSPEFLLFTVTALLGTLLLSVSRQRVSAFLHAQLPLRLRRRLAELRSDLRQSFGGWARAQLLLMGMTFFELLLAFFLMHIERPALAAVLTALVDALPVFGVGTVLLPWAALSALRGDIGRALGLVAVWGLSNLVRSLAQAKLLGDQIGLDPLVSLLGIYVGWRLCGFVGAVLLPILLVTLQQLNDRGILCLWKTQ